MKEKIELINSDRLTELLEQVYVNCLICPKPYDYNSEDYGGLECPDIECTTCWARYLQSSDHAYTTMLKLLMRGRSLDNMFPDDKPDPFEDLI